jgi:ATP/ADP translocase
LIKTQETSQRTNCAIIKNPILYQQKKIQQTKKKTFSKGVEATGLLLKSVFLGALTRPAA